MPFTTAGITQITGLTELDYTLLDSAMDPDGRLWVYYNKGSVDSHKYCFKIYDPTQGLWSSEVEVAPDGDTDLPGSYTYTRGGMVINKYGMAFFWWQTGTNGGGKTKVRTVTSGGTKGSIVTFSNANSANHGCCLNNGCVDFTLMFVDGLAYSNISLADFSAGSNSFGSNYVVYDNRPYTYTAGVDIYTVRQCDYNPIDDTVHCVWNVKNTGTGQPYYIGYAYHDGTMASTPQFLDCPSNGVGSTNYSAILPRIVSDKIEGGKAYMVYASSTGVSVGGATDKLVYREMSDFQWGGEQILYTMDTSGTDYSISYPNIGIDGNGNIHIYYERNSPVTDPYDFTDSVSLTPGLCYQRKLRDSASFEDMQVVAKTTSSFDFSSNVKSIPRLYPTNNVLYLLTEDQGGGGGRIWFNASSDTLGYIDTDDDTQVIPDCSGVDINATPFAQQMYVLDVKGKGGNAWYKHSVVNARVLLKMDDVNDTGELLFGSPSGSQGGRVWRLDYGDNDNLALIKWCWTTPWHDDGRPEEVKRFRYVGIDVADISGGIRVDWSVDGGKATGSFVAQQKGRYWWGDSSNNRSFLWNNSAGSQVQGMYWTDRKNGEMLWSLPQDAIGRRIQLTFSGTYGTPIKQVGYFIEYDGKNELYPSTEGTL